VFKPLAAKRARILLVEGKRGDSPLFYWGLSRKGFDVVTATSGNAAVDLLLQNPPDVILVNAFSMRTSGKRICQSIHQRIPQIPIVLVVDSEHENVDKGVAEVVLTLPFTLQKLLNRLRPLLPAEEKDLIRVGPLNLDVDQRWVRYNNRQISLTPRLVMLLKILMDHPGEVIEREELFRQVWETGYTGDTRTLDVHISWLRQALEEDPRHPRFVKTVRGVGYRLDTDPDTRPVQRNRKVLDS
jgi:DNA-binding response OmpR family regulator